jgi:hypothetical protein
MTGRPTARRKVGNPEVSSGEACAPSKMGLFLIRGGDESARGPSHLCKRGGMRLLGCRSHGLPSDATGTPAPEAPGFTYTSEDSRVSVPLRTSLQDLLPVRAVVSFNLNPEGGLTRSCCLVEGRASSGLAVDPDGSLRGMIMDAAGNWTGAQSPARVVSTGTWHATRLSFTGELHHEHTCPARAIY